MRALDPDWWTPPTDDYAAAYGDGPGHPAETVADYDTGLRFAIERGRPGYALTDD